MSYEKIVEHRVVKNDRLLYSRNTAARLWYFVDDGVQRTNAVATQCDDDGCGML